MLGRLLREVEPELMDGLIQATKDGDQTKFQALSGSELSATEADEEEVEESEYEDDEEVHHNLISYFLSQNNLRGSKFFGCFAVLEGMTEHKKLKLLIYFLEKLNKLMNSCSAPLFNKRADYEACIMWGR